MFLNQQLNLVCVLTPGFFVMALDGFSALQFVPSAPGVLAEIEATIFFNAFCPLILQQKLSRNAI